ncbi:sensor histidine kinase [Eubacteriales bacterium OttesenSCG-928-N13]|nr:sensor histidine kinase [Eubacteriales bacterium OttesenSCG-928-N13]
MDKFLTGSRGSSLQARIRWAHSVLVSLMLVPALIAICLMVVFSSQYHSVIAQMKHVASLMPLIRDELMIEMSDIVVGRTRFEDGRQYDMLDSADAQLGQLIRSDAASRFQLEVARRTLGTMHSLIDGLGEQMGADGGVDQNMASLEEIRNVSTLLLETLQDSINADIDSSAAASDRMQQLIWITLLVEILLLIVALSFAMQAQKSLSRSIREPIEQLMAFAGRIASGELSEREPEPEVEELKELTSSMNAMAEQLQRLIRENTEEQQNLKKSELRALQAQITPHFLYNTLDAIIWLAESKRYSEVIQITRALSNFFRSSLNNGKDWITLEQEREHLEGYLTILRVRYRDILKYEIELDESLLQSQILKLLIQPLVENALYHGIKNRRGGGLLRVRIWREDDFMHVAVSDNGAAMSAERLEQVRASLRDSEPLTAESGYGLISVDRRIKLYYNQPDGLKIESGAEQGTIVGFVVPVKEMGDI